MHRRRPISFAPINEAYLDITANEAGLETAWLTKVIRARIREVTNLNASAGVK